MPRGFSNATFIAKVAFFVQERAPDVLITKS